MFNFDADISIDFDNIEQNQNGKNKIPDDKNKLCCNCSKVIAKTFVRKPINIYKKAFSELELSKILTNNFEDGYSYHCLSNGDIDSLSYLKHIIKQQSLKYVLFSTWCMANDDVFQLKEWIDSKKIIRLDAYCGEIFPGSYKKEYNNLCKIVKECNGRVAICKNHSKIYAGYGEKFYFAIESSANINTNPRIENTTVHIGKDIYDFYKSFYDGIISFDKVFDGWEAFNG